MNKENGVLRTIEAACEALCMGCGEGAHVVGGTQYVMTERMVAEYHVLKFVVNQLRRAVIVALNLITNHLDFLVNLALRVCRVEHNIGEKVDGAGHVVFQYSSIVDGILLVCEGVQVAPDTL